MLDLLSVLPGAGPLATANGRRPSGSGFTDLLGALLAGAAPTPPAGTGGEAAIPLLVGTPPPGADPAGMAGPTDGQEAGPEAIAPSGPPLGRLSTPPDHVAGGSAPAAGDFLKSPPASTGGLVLVGTSGIGGGPADEATGAVQSAVGGEPGPDDGSAAPGSPPHPLPRPVPGQGRLERALGAGEGVVLRAAPGVDGRTAPVSDGAPTFEVAVADPTDRLIRPERWAALPPASSARSRPAADPSVAARTVPGTLQEPAPASTSQGPAAVDWGSDPSFESTQSLRSTEKASSLQEAATTPPRLSASPAASQIEVHLARAAHGRIERLVVQLEPIDLGRVEIRLEFGDEGRVGAVISAERPETLEALQRDAQALERSLREAGLRPEGGGLSFDLKRGSADGGKNHADDRASRMTKVPGTDDVPTAAGRMRSSRLLDIQA